MTTVAVLVLMAAMTTALLAQQQPAVAGLADRWYAIGDARDAATVERFARELEAALAADPALPDAEILLVRLAWGWMNVGRWEAADAALSSAATHAPAGSDVVVWARVDLSIARGNVEDARERLRELINSPVPQRGSLAMSGRDTRDVATVRLAHVEESAGEWSRALAAWTAWQPHSPCGNCGASSSHRRTYGIARCRFERGEREAAIALVRDIVTERDCPNGFHSEALVLYLDMCLRADRLAEAREVVDDLDDDGGLLAVLGLGGDDGRGGSSRAFHLRPAFGLAIAEAAAAGKPDDIIDVMRTVDPRARNTSEKTWPPVDPEWRFAGRTLRRLGAPGRDALLSGVVARDRVAIALAGLAGFQQLRPALEAARSGDAETDALIDDALERLRRGALKRERPERLVRD